VGEFDEIRKRLEGRLNQLVERVARIERDMRKPGHPDSGEQAAELENQEVLERLDEAETREAADIRNALARIESGTYGICDRCGERIDSRRLEVVPFANACIKCAG